MQSSQRQIDIYTKWQGEDCNILINSVAGSGKTTTLLELLRMCEYKTLFLAFNKSIQEEIQSKIDERGLKQGKAMTIHSLGLSAIKKQYRRYKINNNKNWDLIKKFSDKFKRELNGIPWNERVRLSYCLMDMNDISRMFLTNNFVKIKKQFLAMDKNLPEISNLEDYWLTFAELRDATYEGDIIEIDFNDMIYLPVIKNLNIPVNPYYLFVDECQDLNLCQHTLIENLINQGDVHKWVAVGDKNQAIYGFSGAYSSSFDIFAQRDNVCEMVLDICYRCSTSIIDSANQVYNVMAYHKSHSGTVDVTSNPNNIKENSMVVCRNSGPLISLYFQLLALNKNCFIKGEDILNSIIRFIKPYNKLTVSAALTEMSYKLEDLSQNNSDEGKMKFYVFKEDFGNFQKIVQHLCGQFETIDNFLNKLKSLFIDKEDAIMLCTIHKSKGLEADVVYILNENLIPSKFAKNPEQLRQEQNLKYVARTRAKEEMYFLNI